MNSQDFTTSVLVDKSPREAFNAINNVRGWWSEEIKGDSSKLNDEFSYHYEDLHRCKMKLIEVIPDKKVVWLVLDNYFQFTKDKSEWKGTKIIFDIAEKNGKTEVRFTHEGLGPEVECFNDCSGGWNYYLHCSLFPMITTGKGKPDKKEIAMVKS